MPYAFIVPESTGFTSPKDGRYLAKITKVENKDKDGKQLSSRNGDPQWQLTLEISKGVGLRPRITLPVLDSEGNPSGENGIALLSILKNIVLACGVDLTAGEKCEISSRTFLNKIVDIQVEETTGGNDKKYTNVKTWYAPTAEPATAEDDDILL
jgi:hypothetical protein